MNDQTLQSSSRWTDPHCMDLELKALQLTLKALLEGWESDREQESVRKQQPQQMLYWGGWRETRWAQQEITMATVKYLTCEEEERAIVPSFCTSEAVCFNSVRSDSELSPWSSTSGGIFPVLRWEALQTATVMRSRASVHSRPHP